MAIFGPNPFVNPLGEMLIFRLFRLLVFITQKGVFSFQNIIKDIFQAYIALKKKDGKIAIFGPKPWVNPFRKNVNFSTFWTCCFYSLEWRFFVLKYHKRHFPGLYCLKKKVGKMAIFGPKPLVNPFGKMSIFRLFELLVFVVWIGVFSFQNIVKDIFLAYIA